MSIDWQPSLGATILPDGRTRFLVWAPHPSKVELHIVGDSERIVAMEAGERGYYEAVVEGAGPGTQYFYRLEGERDRPDPASRYQPLGVHGPSEVVDPSFAWTDADWRGAPLEQYILYETHVGTFTLDGTFEAMIGHLDELVELGVTALELLPVAQFPGDRNWGYDGVQPYAVQSSYGGPEGLRKLVDACHARGLAVVLDVVYNHLGPEGNYLREYGPYFTDRYHTFWGDAMNFDGPGSDEVRRYFIENALHWIREYHIDAFRLDAVDHIIDHHASARPFLRELADTVHEQAASEGRHVYAFAETAMNDTRFLLPAEGGGCGLDAQWNDEFHHALHSLLTGEDAGYYRDFGSLEDMARAFREGYVYTGQYSPNRERRHGTSSKDIPASKFVVFRQNHDQVGNRVYGRRLARLVSFEGIKVAASAVLLSPYIPLLFMGEEYYETASFLYFTSHSDPDLVEAVRAGRQDEFSAFEWGDEPLDSQDEAMFHRSKLDRSLRADGPHQALLEFYTELIALRKSTPALSLLSKEHLEVDALERERMLVLRRWNGESEAAALFNFSDTESSASVRLPEGHWRKRIDSADERWQGPGSALPDNVESAGEIEVVLRPLSVGVFLKEPA
ncbi:MAG: malto-oligosyltrehalose trehalohydrolase [Dehalococcoidia bacterium]